MTALTMASQSEEDTRLPPVPWRRMAWVIWRQHRSALTAVAVFLGALAVSLWRIGLQLHHAYAAAAACRPVLSPACDALQTSFSGMDILLANGYVLQAVPALIGAFAGAPVLARELETGTFRYVWAQGFGRCRWTLAKLVPLAVVVTVAAGALSVLLSWYYQPYLATRNQALFLPEDSPLTNLFVLRGIAFAAWTLTAFAIGALAGMLIRRVVPAIVATLAAYTGLAFAAALYLRQQYLPPLLSRNLFNPPASAWIIRQWWTKGGTTLSQTRMSQLMRQMFYRIMRGMHAVNDSHVKAQKGQANLEIFHYLTRHGYAQWTSYQPASRFWPFQWIEGGWLLTLSALLIVATLWLVRRRAA